MLQVTHADPRRLLVRCDAPCLSCWFLVAHVPHSGRSAQDRAQWWQDTDTLIDAHSDMAPWIWLIDANASPGHADGDIVQTCGLRTSPGTALLRQSLAVHEMCLPSTTHIHQGPRATWTDPSGKDDYCIDYVAVSRSLRGSCTLSCVLDTFEIGNLREDHKAVALQLQWFETVLWLHLVGMPSLVPGPTKDIMISDNFFDLLKFQIGPRMLRHKPVTLLSSVDRLLLFRLQVSTGCMPKNHICPHLHGP